MSDILDDLEWLLERLKAEGDPDGSFRECRVTSAVIDEIKRLRLENEELSDRLETVGYELKERS